MNFATKFENGLTYRKFLDKYGTDEHKRRWDAFSAEVNLTDAQKELLRSFTRQMKVLVLAGTWCGDCVNQCPIWEHLADELRNSLKKNSETFSCVPFLVGGSCFVI